MKPGVQRNNFSTSIVMDIKNISVSEKKKRKSAEDIKIILSTVFYAVLGFYSIII